MKIFTRYMIKLFLGPFLYGLGAFALIVFLGDLFDKMNRIATSRAAGWDIAQYMALQIPYWTVRVVPMATLLATLFAVTSFVSSGEFVAVQAAGVRVKDLFKPVLWVSLAIGALGFLAQEAWLPACYVRAQRLWHEKIHPEWEWEMATDAVLAGGADRYITATVFRVKDGTMTRPVMDYYREGRLARELDAALARWDPVKSVWVFEKGVVREFLPSGIVGSEKAFAALESDLDVPPRKLMPRSKDPDEMSMIETRRYIQRLQALGQNASAAKVAFQAKVAFPFANVVLCALGIPIALRLRRSSRAVCFAAALVTSFFYLWVIEVGKALGGRGGMSPLISAWLPNLVFGALAAWLYRRAEI